MNKYAIVENGVIANIIIAESEIKAGDVGAVPFREGLRIGDAFEAPLPNPTTEERLAALESAMLAMMFLGGGS